MNRCQPDLPIQRFGQLQSAPQRKTGRGPGQPAETGRTHWEPDSVLGEQEAGLDKLW